jgi:hypothetical protein
MFYICEVSRVGRSGASFYSKQLSSQTDDAPRPDLDLSGAAQLAGLEEEIKLLRALVKQAVQLGKSEEVRRLVLALCGALRLQRSLASQSVEDDRSIIDQALAEIEREVAS